MKASSVTFFGTVYGKDGAHPDPKKVEATHKMLAPQDPQKFQRFQRMITKLSPFIRSVSTFTTPLHKHKDFEFTWKDSYQSAFEMIKKMVCRDTTLWYFDIFASKALTPT